jgi:hypothetical protein
VTGRGSGAQVGGPLSARAAGIELAEAEFDPETGVVTVYEGRREFRALERAAHRGGLSRRRVREYLPYRMLEVEVAANAAYAWAAREVVARRVGEHAADGPTYAEAIRLETQALRYRARARQADARLPRV